MGTDYRSLYDKDYIGAWDLQDRDVTVTITKVIGGSLVGSGGRKAKKPVVYMHGTEKGFAVNATNGKTIAALYGNMIEEWVGKRITLYKSMTRNPNGDGDVECIRVRPKIPPSKGAKQEAQLSEPAPAAPAPTLGEPTQSELVADVRRWIAAGKLDMARDLLRGVTGPERTDLEAEIDAA